MSRRNKVNKTNYVQRGRLTPDDMARERKRQAEVSARAKGKTRITAEAPAAPPRAAGSRAGRAATLRRSAREE